MRLETSKELLERIRALHGDASWYRLAKIVGTSESTINNWKHGRSGIGDDYALRIAELLEEPAEYVLACLEAERTSNADVRKVWARIAAKFRSQAASILLTALLGALLAAPGESRASADLEAGAAAHRLYIMENRRRRLSRWALKNNNARPLLPGLWARIRSWACALKSWSGSPVYT